MMESSQNTYILIREYNDCEFSLSKTGGHWDMLNRGSDTICLVYKNTLTTMGELDCTAKQKWMR